MQFKKLHESATLPSHGRRGDVGYDLYATEGVALLPGEQKTIGTGLAVAIPIGCYGRIAERSGLAAKGLSIGGGVIDPNYRGEIRIIVRHLGFVIDGNFNREPIVIPVGQAIAQLILERVGEEDTEWVDELGETERGIQGFGSSGR